MGSPRRRDCKRNGKKCVREGIEEYIKAKMTLRRLRRVSSKESMQRWGCVEPIAANNQFKRY